MADIIPFPKDRVSKNKYSSRFGAVIIPLNNKTDIVSKKKIKKPSKAKRSLRLLDLLKDDEDVIFMG